MAASILTDFKVYWFGTRKTYTNFAEAATNFLEALKEIIFGELEFLDHLGLHTVVSINN